MKSATVTILAILATSTLTMLQAEKFASNNYCGEGCIKCVVSDNGIKGCDPMEGCINRSINQYKNTGVYYCSPKDRIKDCEIEIMIGVTNKCKVCNPGFIIANGACEAVKKEGKSRPCLHFGTSNEICTSCKSDYYLWNNNCLLLNGVPTGFVRDPNCEYYTGEAEFSPVCSLCQE